MHAHEKIIKSLKSQGFRMTQVRRRLLELFSETNAPLSVPEIDDALMKKHLDVNKTTIYRELEFLVDKKLIQSIQFNEDKKRYELVGDHHHHLVCERCQEVEEIKIEELEDIFPKVEKRLRKLKGFTVVDHSLEFFGTCGKCT